MFVTLILVAFNQEEYIDEAIEGALAQTYGQLEIIISDDCSTDATYENSLAKVRAYTGSHRVIVRRNDKNLGINRHVQLLHSMASGELIVHASGDDISAPERVQLLVDAFQNAALPPSLLMSNAIVIGPGGERLGTFSDVEEYRRDVEGDPTDFSSIGAAATYALAREVVERFPPADPCIYGEDRLALFRAILLNGFAYIPDKLVKYRISEKGVWSSTFISELSDQELLDRHVRRSEDYLLLMKQLRKDIQAVSHPKEGVYAARISDIEASHNRLLSVIRGDFFSSLCAANPISGLRDWQLIKLFVIRWMPALRKIRKLWPATPVRHPALANVGVREG